MSAAQSMPSRPVRLACVVNSLKVGGSERVMATLANELSELPGVSVDVIVYGRGREVFYELAPQVRLQLPDFAFDNRHRRRMTVKTLGFVRRVIARGRYDAVLSFGERWNNFVMLAAVGLPTPIVLSDRSSPSLELGRVHGTLRRLLYPRAAGLLAQTERARQVARERGLNDVVTVVPNPVAPHSPAPGVTRGRSVISVGRLVKTKHHDRLLRVFASLPRQDWTLKIVGDDAQQQRRREGLEALAAELGISERVAFTGDSADVGRHLDESSIFAFTSSVEGFPNAVAEALAAGVPVVTYDCDAGPADLVKDGDNGYLVPVFDDAMFAQRLAALMEDDALRERMAARAAASVAHLAPAGVAQQVFTLLTASADSEVAC